MRLIIALLLLAMTAAWAAPTPPDWYMVRPGVCQIVVRQPHVLAVLPRPSTPTIPSSLGTVTRVGSLTLVTNPQWDDLQKAADEAKKTAGLDMHAVYLENGQRVVLTGNVFVTLKAGVDARAWAEAHHLTLRPMAGGTWIFDAGVGTRPLQVADALLNDPKVAWAAPDWLRKMSTR